MGSYNEPDNVSPDDPRYPDRGPEEIHIYSLFLKRHLSGKRGKSLTATYCRIMEGIGDMEDIDSLSEIDRFAINNSDVLFTLTVD